MESIGRRSQEFVPWQPRYSEPIDKIRLVVVSADFNTKPVGQLVQSVFGIMDGERFEVVCFSLQKSDGSPMIVKIANSVEEFIFVDGMASIDIALLVNTHQPHILLDITGYTDGGRVEVGTLKPAPISVNYLALPHTYAADGYDYVLTDQVVSPPEALIPCWVESFVYLPGMYMVSDYRQSHLKQIERGHITAEDARSFGVPHRDNGVVFANFNHLQKLGPRTFGLWMEAMLPIEAPTSSTTTATTTKNASSSPSPSPPLLWLLKFPLEAQNHLEREASQRGVDPSRLVFTSKFDHSQHLFIKGAASMLLDTLEYNAHVSGLDALWAGLPLVTMAGSNMARRCGASLLIASGVPDTIARSEDEYVAIARALASGGSKAREVRERVEAGRLGGTLFNTKVWVRGFERALVAMWDVHVGRGGRAHISLPTCAKPA